MEADNNPRAARPAAEDFPAAADPEAFHQVAEMNLRGLRVLRDALLEVPNTVGPVDGLILKRLIPETDDFQYQVGVYPHRWG